ncbi:MAG: DUF5657 family protein [bacterium]
MDVMRIFDAITFLSIVKVMLVMLLGVYAVFAMLMMRQIAAMTKAITMRDDYIIRILGILNFGFAIVVLLMAIFIL